MGEPFKGRIGTTTADSEPWWPARPAAPKGAPNVLVIREKSGKRSVKRLNLQSKNIFTSPYYYLQQNDVVYVEPPVA